MPLTQSQKAVWSKARSAGSGGQAVSLDDGACSYLIARIAADLELEDSFPEFTSKVDPFFSNIPVKKLSITGINPLPLFERLVSLIDDGDTYFSCIARLHRARLKYEIILESQPFPTIEQVGPRALLQYGQIKSSNLTALLFWRKWLYDLDNRAAQETGYLFEPVIAGAVGGTEVSATNSPVRRRSNKSKGRQIDCYIDDSEGQRAYEIKLRVTIAASGQGRWGEEIDFPADCRASNIEPILVVLDGTENEKLTQLKSSFIESGGKAYIGDSAWKHLEDLAGNVMSNFIERYVRKPIEQLVEKGDENLPSFKLIDAGDSVNLEIGDESMSIIRK